jgi:hypothetical protein
MLACMLGIVDKIIPEAVGDWNPHVGWRRYSANLILDDSSTA